MRLNINNKDYQVTCEPTDRLADVLRECLGLTGTKTGCKEGECGACAVIIDGELCNSCLVAAGSLEDSKVTTIEGLVQTPQFEILNKAFADAGAVQCGYCIPAMIMAAEALLEKNPNPGESDVRQAISGNICRCTGYNMIIEAVLLASERGDGIW